MTLRSMESGEFEELLFEGGTIQLLTSVQKPSMFVKENPHRKKIMSRGILPLDQKAISQLVLEKLCLKDYFTQWTNRERKFT